MKIDINDLKPTENRDPETSKAQAGADASPAADRLNVTLCGIGLDNPVIAASGTFGYGYEFAELYDINELGTFSFKGTTAEPRFGNPTPRIAETSSYRID